MSAEEALRRQLKFSFVLQLAGGALFALATVVRAISVGFDGVTILFLAATLIISAAAVFTRTRMSTLG